MSCHESAPKSQTSRSDGRAAATEVNSMCLAHISIAGPWVASKQVPLCYQSKGAFVRAEGIREQFPLQIMPLVPHAFT
ncbi:unnamed protein product [Heligmosomoides polygyrus]|uniref:Uncharacterized protein n=1 Tax=Heligmosomoides polygyrus TaxID=6339 RepID=A0A183GEG4_HELPZ|nr:unnamed protein product [Heligmosomoides polygyrus]